MAVYSLIAILSGLGLVPFFRAVVLAPATLIAVFAMATVQASIGESIAHGIVACVSAATALQLGFLVGQFASWALSKRQPRYGRA
jgi:NAD/NADP transhydrogenase alpha subunit